MFKFEKGTLHIDADMLGTFPAFAALYNRDKSPEKRLSQDQFICVFHMVDLRSPYAESDINGRLTHIVHNVFKEEELHPELHEWFKANYIPVKVNAAKAKNQRKRKKEGEDIPPEEEAKEVIQTDVLFERAVDQYRRNLDLLPEHAMMKAGATAVHRLAAQIEDPNNKNATDDLEKMNKAVENLKKLRESTKAAEEQQRTTKGGHSVRKREDPDYLFLKQRIK